MAIDPMQTLQLTAGPPAAEFTHLGVVPDSDAADGAREELADLQLRLETERSAGRALLEAITELERRLGAERATGEALLATVRELEEAVVAERAQVSSQRESNGQLWSQVIELSGALVLAERPLWRKLLRRS